MRSCLIKLMMGEKSEDVTDDETVYKNGDGYIPESRLYNQLVDFEKEVDAIINRKKFEILEQRGQVKMTKRTLRIFISNVYSSGEISNGLNLDKTFSPSWTLLLEGRLLDLPRSRKVQSTSSHMFSSFIKTIIIQLDKGTNKFETIEWNKQNSPNLEFDGIEIKRIGSNNEVKVKILIYLDYKPDTFKLSKLLSNLLDIHTDTSTNVVMALWKYIKSKKLQDSLNKRCINCDSDLTEVFSRNKFQLSELPLLIKPHLLPPDPVVIDYVISPDKEYYYSPTAYDVSIDTVNLFARQKSATLLISSSSQHRDIALLNRKIQKILKSISHAQLKRDFLNGFIQDPVAFMEQWIASQSRDLESILGEPWLDISEISQSSLFTGDNARSAIMHYLNQFNPPQN